jgi:hypothetical protein
MEKTGKLGILFLYNRYIVPQHHADWSHKILGKHMLILHWWLRVFYDSMCI